MSGRGRAQGARARARTCGRAGARTGNERMPNLHELELTVNRIVAEVAKAIAQVMPQMPNLNELDLRENSIAAEGAKTIAQAMPQMLNLKELNLRKNWIGAELSKAIAQAMPPNGQALSLVLLFVFMRVLILVHVD